MLGKVSVVLVLCQIVVSTYGGVLVRPVEILEDPEQEPKCSELYGNCSVNEDCCDFMRCMDFGGGNECLYGTDNPQVDDEVNDAIQPPIDLLPQLGCGLYAQACEVREDCCAPYVCSAEGTCEKPYVDMFGMGGYGNNPGYPGK